MSPARKEDESVETSLRELMRQEEDRLEQLRLAKARIDRERAEAAREAEEERLRREREEQAELEAKKAGAVERARIEALAKAEVAPRVVVVEAPAAAPKARFEVGFATGLCVAICAVAVGWFGVAAPRIAHAAKLVEDARAELERERSHSRDVAAAAEAALADHRSAIDALRAENDRLRRAAESPKVTPRSNLPPPQKITRAKPSCDPLDPLCGDL